MEKGARVKLILSQCEKAGPFKTHDEAFDAINRIIDEFEDEHSPDPYDPEGRSRDRIYGPSKNFASASSFDGLIEYGHVNHITLINSNGAFMIIDRKGNTLLDRPGVDGGFCPR